MRSTGVWTQDLRLSFPARLLGSGAKRGAKQGGRGMMEVLGVEEQFYILKLMYSYASIYLSKLPQLFTLKVNYMEITPK